ncbi:MAG: hypothetical protein SV253_09100 [Halobacteria archaeon]|nr:hypothetical protein [Halobacteria archaeon]
MSSRSPEEDKSARPSRLIHDAQEMCSEWRAACIQVHRLGERADIPRDEAVRRYNTWIIEYASRLSPHVEKNKASKIEKLWEKKTYSVTTKEGVRADIDGLSELLSWGFREIERKETHDDVIEGKHTETYIDSADIDPEHLARIHSDLDLIAAEIGFAGDTRTLEADDEEGEI